MKVVSSCTSGDGGKRRKKDDAVGAGFQGAGDVPVFQVVSQETGWGSWERRGDKSPDGWGGQRKHLETVSSERREGRGRSGRWMVHHLLMMMVPNGEILRFEPVFL